MEYIRSFIGELRGDSDYLRRIAKFLKWRVVS